MKRIDRKGQTRIGSRGPVVSKKEKVWIDGTMLKGEKGTQRSLRNGTSGELETAGDSASRHFFEKSQGGSGLGSGNRAW